MKLLRGFPKRYDDAPEATGENWMAHYRQALATIDSGGIVVMYGAHGTGKTRMSWELAKKCNPKDAGHNNGGLWKTSIRREKPAIYTTAVGLFTEIRDTYRKNSEFSETQVIKKYSEAALIVIDEMQDRRDTDFEGREITGIIDARYRDAVPTILISNHSRENFAKSLSPAVIERIRENGCGLHFNWTSFRKQSSI